jgi:tetrahydromethanopterin S-methyltransferase subunit B
MTSWMYGVEIEPKKDEWTCIHTGVVCNSKNDFVRVEEFPFATNNYFVGTLEGMNPRDYIIGNGAPMMHSMNTVPMYTDFDRYVDEKHWKQEAIEELSGVRTSLFWIASVGLPLSALLGILLGKAFS